MGNEVTQSEAVRFNFWFRVFMVSGKMNKELTLPEATQKKTILFDSRFSIFWWRSFVVGGDMGNEAKQPQAAKTDKHL